MKRGRGQVSVEYLLVVGMAFLLLLPGGYLFYSFSKGSQDQLASAQIVRGGSEIINAVESMYAIGKNSWTTVTVNFPDTARSAYVIDDHELVVEYETNAGLTHAVFFSDINLTTPYAGGSVSDTFHTGIMKIKVAYKDAAIELSEI